MATNSTKASSSKSRSIASRRPLAPKPTAARPAPAPARRQPFAAAEFSTGRGRALRQAATTRLASSGLAGVTPAAQQAPARTFPGISQKTPDGPQTPPSYASAKDRLYNCGPTAMATVLRGFGVKGLPASNTELVQQLRKELGTRTPEGSAAAALPGAFAKYGLRTEQRPVGESAYTSRNFYKLKGDAARTEALEKVLGKDEAAALAASIKAGKTTWDQARTLAHRRETEEFIAGHADQGHPVMMNVNIRVLHPAGTGGGHFVTVTGVERGADGRVSSYAIVDPWTGEAAKIPADQLWKAIEQNSPCAPTAVFP